MATTVYTIGIYFNEDLTKVALILKNRPKWQAGRYNFPGGKMEENEAGVECTIREFKEECTLNTKPFDWKQIGVITNNWDYLVYILVGVHKPEHGELKKGEDQKVKWVNVNRLPKNRISNVKWLVEFALNTLNTESRESLIFGHFVYEPKNIT